MHKPYPHTLDQQEIVYKPFLPLPPPLDQQELYLPAGTGTTTFFLITILPLPLQSVQGTLIICLAP